MRRLRTSCLLLALLLRAVAARDVRADDRIVIAAGPEGGSYFHIAARLKTELILRNETLPAVQTTQGSLENLARLQDPESPVNVALAQADALRSHLEAHPEFRERAAVLGDMGPECLLLVASRNGNLRSAADLKRPPGGALAVDAPASGAALTYRTLTELEPAFEATRPVHDPTPEALLQLVAGQSFSSLRGVLIVQRPSVESPALRSVLDARERYRLAPFGADDVPPATLPDGSPVYTWEKVAIGAASRAERPELTTLCTRALLLASRDKLPRELRGRLSRLMLEVGEQIAGGEP